MADFLRKVSLKNNPENFHPCICNVESFFLRYINIEKL